VRLQPAVRVARMGVLTPLAPMSASFCSNVSFAPSRATARSRVPARAARGARLEHHQAAEPLIAF
jgi:hypothetical protein